MSQAEYQILEGDVLDILKTLPSESIHCAVTSPPYWGLRDYGTGEWSGGDPDCNHKKQTQPRSGRANPSGSGIGKGGAYSDAQDTGSVSFKDVCKLCGAQRIDSQIGMESTPELYVANLVSIFRELRRVLRSDGSFWLNIGDTRTGGRLGRQDKKTGGGLYNEGQASWEEESTKHTKAPPGYKQKDLIGVPWMLAFALRSDGWYLRSDIIWSKPGGMPESVTDRPTSAHEYLFLLTKSRKYYYDGFAIKEPLSKSSIQALKRRPKTEEGKWQGSKESDTTSGLDEGRWDRYVHAEGANKRDVWSINTEPFAGEHFAAFPTKLVEPCIKAGTCEQGVCLECGAPWVREFEEDKHVGWQRTCEHTAPAVPATVLDPFMGTGTTLEVARYLGRDSIGIELSPKYIDIAEKRLHHGRAGVRRDVNQSRQQKELAERGFKGLIR